MSASAVTAAKRFGLGQTRRQIDQISQNPKNYVREQLDRPEGLEIKADLLPSNQVWQQNRNFVIARREARNRGDMAAVAALAKPKFYQQEVFAHINHAIATPTPFLERLSWFWSNHFCVSARKGTVVRHLTGSYVREAIRPHVLGNFRDMLQAVIRHPAMLIYLDNIRSFGPNSPNGLRRNKGLNENLAREAMELHTLGVNGGYTQDDVINFAKALTGWSIGWRKGPTPGKFRFYRQNHEPGTVTVLGKRYDQPGEQQAAAVLDDFARHPSTARFIARKLAVHFIGENAPETLIDKLAESFQSSNGNLKAVARTLANAPESWDGPAVKFLPPLDSLVTVARAIKLDPSEKFIRRTLRIFGQPMWGPPSPAGWSDEDNVWASGDALLERLDWAYRISSLLPPETRREVLKVSRDLFGQTLSGDTSLAIARAPTRKDAFSLLLLSPEVQRR